MVTAVVIPIILVYFYWLTKKEMKNKEEEWLKIGFVKEEAYLSGKVISAQNEITRFYYHRQILVQELTLQCDTKIIKAKKKHPLSTNTKVETIPEGASVKLYGQWDKQSFLYNRLENSNAQPTN
ncbi:MULTISPECIES: hypothetical protein [unclassified Bacillus (in: firmicutes)]|uniref:hypothetical protein n=1 Tax=unclassified Bacillus (in: firmicutes) TaxID=185979 RepID=UPI0008E256EB|nr:MULTISPECIES: hypothetical protein [unclassified Bacillus (in: firmicutes)]SFA75950.1 hypothetical protein SAMN02799634_101556 [Bacillus sp. UNCCL13]SFQ65940.1 hypothetical protein SAMN04488577_0831 [Bacillus sp. cl95]